MPGASGAIRGERPSGGERPLSALSFLVSGYLLGLGAAAPIGPVNVAIMQRGIRRGFAAAFFLGTGAVAVDCAYFAIAIVGAGGAADLLASRAGRAVAFVFAGALLAWMGWGAIGLARRGEALGAAAEDGASGESARRAALASFALGLAMTAANPMTIVYWIGIAASFAAQSGEGAAASPFLALVGVAAGAGSWVVFLSTLLALTRRRLGPRFVRAVNLVSGIGLAAFGVRYWILAARAAIG